MTAGDVEAFGDRHLRPDPEGKLALRPIHEKSCLRVVLSPQAAATRVGQLGAWLAINLVSRLDSLVTSIEFSGGNVPTDPALFPLRIPSLSVPQPGASTLSDELAQLCARASGGRVDFRASGASSRVDVELIVGGSEVSAGSAPAVWCYGDGWLAYVGTAPSHAMPDLQSERNPLGMYLAVCYGVGEVFKKLRGVVDPGRSTISQLAACLWSGQTAASWQLLSSSGESPDSLVLPSAYVVGGGAVSEAALFAAATATAGCTFATIVDGERVDRNNRNRYILAFRDHEGAWKAHHAASFLQAHNIPAHGAHMHWLPYMSRVEQHPDQAHATAERDLRYPLVLSCVDTNLAREHIQATWPRDVIGGSTDGLRAQSVFYDLRSEAACLMCYNPVTSIEQQASLLREELAKLPQRQWELRLLELGFRSEDVGAALEYLARKRCGELGEHAVKHFAENGPPAFSVGFVSVAAGLLLVRNWVQYALAGPAGLGQAGHQLNVNFFNGRFGWTEQLQRDGCRCNEARRTTWPQLWR